MLLRSKSRVDYKKLHTSGVKSIKKSIKEGSNSDMDEVRKLKIEINVLSSDLADLIDENPIPAGTPDDDELNVAKLEELRSILKTKTMELQSIDPDAHSELEESYLKTLAMVKEYIKASKDNKNKCKLLDIKSKSDESK